MEPATFNQILADEIENTLKPSRFLHVLGVAHTAVALAVRHGVDPVKAAAVALLHDISKPIPPGEIEADLARRGIEIPEDDRPYPAIWHGLHAAVRLRDEFGITAEHGLDEMAEAVHFHSTAEAGAGSLTRVLFMADTLEPGRDHENIAGLRAAARQSLEHGFRLTLEYKIIHVSESAGSPSPRALRARAEVNERSMSA